MMMPFKEFETEEDFNKFIEETKGEKPFKSFSEDEWSDFETSIDSEKKAKYDEGVTTGHRKLFRDLKVDEGLDFEGKGFDYLPTLKQKLRDKLKSELGEGNADAIKELEGDVMTLRSQLEEKESLVSQAKSELSEYKIGNKINSNLPEIQGIDRNDFVLVAKSSLEFTIDEDGNEVVKKNGEIVKGKTRKPLSYKEALENFASDRGYLSNVDQGRGNQSKKKNANNGSFKSMADLELWAESNDISFKSQEFQKKLAEVSRDKSFQY